MPGGAARCGVPHLADQGVQHTVVHQELAVCGVGEARGARAEDVGPTSHNPSRMRLYLLQRPHEMKPCLMWQQASASLPSFHPACVSTSTNNVSAVNRTHPSCRAQSPWTPARLPPPRYAPPPPAPGSPQRQTGRPPAPPSSPPHCCPADAASAGANGSTGGRVAGFSTRCTS